MSDGRVRKIQIINPAVRKMPMISNPDTMPLFRSDSGYEEIPEEGTNFLIRIAKKSGAKYYMNAVRKKDGKTEIQCFSAEDFGKNEIRDEFGRGDYRVTLYCMIGEDEFDIWSRRVTIADGDEKLFFSREGVILTNGSFVDYDEYDKINVKNTVEKNEEEVKKPFFSGFGNFPRKPAMPSSRGVSSLLEDDPEIEENDDNSEENEENEENEESNEREYFDRKPFNESYFKRSQPPPSRSPVEDRFRPSSERFSQREMVHVPKENPPPEQKSQLKEIIEVVTPLLTPLIIGFAESWRAREKREEEESRHRQQLEYDRREEERKRREAEEERRREERRKDDLRYEQMITREEELRRARAIEEENRMRERKQWEYEMRLKEDEREERRRLAEEKKEEERRSREEESRRRIEEEKARIEEIKRRELIQNQYAPQLSEMMRNYDSRNKNEEKPKTAFDVLNEFREMREALEKVGINPDGGKAGPGGLEQFIGNVLTVIPEEKVGKLVQVIGEKLNMLPGSTPEIGPPVDLS